MKGRFILLLCVIVLLGANIVSAFEFDNYYSYNESTRTASFKNGLTFGSKIAEIKLNTPLDMHVAPGYNYVFELETWGDVDYSDFVRGIYVHDKKNGYGLVNRRIDLKFFNGYETKYRDINGCVSENLLTNGTIICEEYGVVDTEEYQVEVWDNLLPRDLRKNDHLIIRGYTNVEVGDKMEWYIDFFGAGKNTGHGTKGVKEWASWTADLNVDLTLYYKLDEVSGNANDSNGVNDGIAAGITYGNPGIINNSFTFLTDAVGRVTTTNNIGITGSASRSISFWTNQDAVAGGANWIFQYGENTNFKGFGMFMLSNGDLQFWGASSGDFDTGITLSLDTTYHIVVTYDGTSVRVYLDGVLQITTAKALDTTDSTLKLGVNSGDTNNMDGWIDEFAIWNRTLNASVVLQLYNNGTGITFTDTFESIDVTLNDPDNNSIQSSSLVEFNWTITPVSLNITNWTLNVFFENGTLAVQEINTTINTDLTTTVLHNETISDGNYVWNVESCGTNGADTCDLSDNRTFSIDTLSPLLNITSPVDGFIVTEVLENITINFTINDSGGTLDQCWLNTSLNSTPNFIVCADNVTSALYPASAPDSVTLFLSANDTAGNVGTTNVTVFKNTVAPIVNITAPAEGFIVTQFNQSIDLNWTVSDNATLDQCFYTLNENSKDIVKVSTQNTTSAVNETSIDNWLYQNINFTSIVTGSNGNRGFETITNITNVLSGTFINFTLEVDGLMDGNAHANGPVWVRYFNISFMNTSGDFIIVDNYTQLTKPGTGWTASIINFTGIPNEEFLINDTLVIRILLDYHDPNIGSFAAGARLLLNNSNINLTAKTFVNCSDNTTIINYPTTNPDNLLISFFSNDTFGNTGSDSVTIFKSQVEPTINITAPVDTFSSLVNGQSLDLNFTITNSTSLDACSFEYNGVNTSVTCSENVSTTFNYVSGINTITVFVNDTLGNLANASKSFVSSFDIVNESFDEEILVSQTNDFRLDVITTASSITSPELIYDGVEYSATLNTINSTNFFLTASVTTFENLTGNNTFFWNVTLDGQEFSSSDSHQNVSDINFSICDGSNNVTFFRVDFIDETTSSSLNATIRTSTFDYWIDDEAAKRTYLFGVTTNSSDYEFCFFPSEETINIDASISYNADGFPERTSSVVTTLNNVSTNVTLSLLSVDDGLYATFTFVDSITKVGLDSVTVEISEAGNLIIATVTDSSGSISEFLNPNILYQVDFSKTGYASGSQNRRPISTEPLVIEMDNELFEAEDELTNGLFVQFYPTIRKLDNNTIYGFGFFASEGAVEIDTLIYTVFDEDGVAIATVARSGEGNMTQTNLNTSGNGTMTIIAEIYGDDGSNVNYTVVFEISNFQSTKYSLDQWGLSFDGYFPTETRTTLTRFVMFFLWFIIMLGGFTFGYNGSFKNRSDYTDNTSTGTRGNTATGLLFAFLITLIFSYFNLIPAPFVPGNGSNIFTNGLLRQNFFAALLLIPLLWDLFGASVSKYYRSGH